MYYAIYSINLSPDININIYICVHRYIGVYIAKKQTTSDKLMEYNSYYHIL